MKVSENTNSNTKIETSHNEEEKKEIVGNLGREVVWSTMIPEDTSKIFLYIPGLVLCMLTVMACGFLPFLALIVILATIFTFLKLLLLKTQFLPSLIPMDLWFTSSTKDEGPLIVLRRDKGSDSSPISGNSLCLICGDLSCGRHDSRETVNLMPWKGLLINGSVNEAIEDIMDETIEYYINSWYLPLVSPQLKSIHAANDRTVFEIRLMIKYLICNFILKVREKDVTDIILQDLLKPLLNHIECYLIGKRMSKSAQFVEACTLDYYEKIGSIHPAIKSREDEIAWLQRLSQLILPYLLPPNLYLNSPQTKSFVRELLGCSIFLPTFDIVCDPETINLLIVSLLDSDSHILPRDETFRSEMVEIFKNYPQLTIEANLPSTNSPKHKRKNCSCNQMGIALRNVMKDEQMLFMFMNFLKEQAAVHLIHFIMTVDSFNASLMDPDLTSIQLKTLHEEAVKVYNTYLKDTAIDFISFKDQKIITEIQDILFCRSGPEYQNVVKLRTSEALYLARDEVFQVLESHYLCLFFESPSYLKMVCGSRWVCYEVSAQDSPSESLASCAIGNGFSRQKISSRNHHRRQSSMSSIRLMKESIWPSADDGLIPPSVSSQNLKQSSSANEIDRIEKALDLMEALSEPPPASPQMTRSLNDLSQWKVNIPKIETRLDNNLKYYHVFSIDVQRIESGSSKVGNKEDLDKTITNNPQDDIMTTWTVERRYPEFYELESRLKGFHGDNLQSNVDFVSLPSRKTFSPRLTIPFLESKREDFESFLQSLVSNERLKGSQLVFNFLKSPEEFTTNILPDINLRRMMKSVPAKLTQEKGQNLDQFLSSLMDSTKAPKAKPMKPDLNDMIFAENPSEFTKANLMNSIFRDNCASLERIKDDEVPPKVKMFPALNSDTSIGSSSLVDYLLFFMTRLFSFRPSSKFVQIVLSLECLLRSTFQDFIHHFTSSTLKSTLMSPRVVVKLIRLLKGALYGPSNSSDAESAKDLCKRRREEAMMCLKNFFTSLSKSQLASFALSSETLDVDQISFVLFSMFQNPVLNKQLFFTWIDQVTRHFFPQIVVIPRNPDF